MLGFNQSMKMADIPFPFPFAQLLEFLLVTLTTIVPFYAALFTEDLLVTPVLSFSVTLAFWSLLEISCVLENPFIDGPNQLPIIDCHERFVEVLRTVYHSETPKALPADEEPEPEDAADETNGTDDDAETILDKNESSTDARAISSGGSLLQKRGASGPR